MTGLLVALSQGTTAVSAQSSATVEVRVWQGVSDAHNLYISARPEGGSWRTLGTIPLDMSGRSSRGTFTYGDITVAVPLGGARAPNQVNVEVRVWQSVSDALDLYISARPEGGSWGTLGTIPLDMSGLNSRGTFRYGDIDVAVPLWFVGVGKTGGTTYNAYIMDDGSLFTSIGVHDGDGRVIREGESTFSFRCIRGSLQAIFKVSGAHFFPETTSVEWETSNRDPFTERWRIGGGVIGDWFYAPDSRFVLEQLREAQSLKIRLRNAEGRILTTDDGDLRIYPHDVSSLLTTPAQMNIERCGQEGWR
ncbi:MAG: hypothetical protein F4Z48_05945 [Dehalococcoidia bacterium]|nr:hypothetical protein [Dehalococcoidia bacterium]